MVMENSTWQSKYGSVWQASSSQQNQEMTSTNHRVVQEPINPWNSISNLNNSSHSEIRSSFLSLLSTPSNTNLSIPFSKNPITSKLASNYSIGIGNSPSSSRLLTPDLNTQKTFLSSRFLPNASTKSCLNNDISSTERAKSLFPLKDESISSNFPCNIGNYSNGPNVSSMSRQSSQCPRVFCFGASGYLILSSNGLLGVVCTCHNIHMSVSKFSEHSGLSNANSGNAVLMGTGETIAQWRKDYFGKFGIRIPRDDSEWDWPERFSQNPTFPEIPLRSDVSRQFGASQVPGQYRNNGVNEGQNCHFKGSNTTSFINFSSVTDNKAMSRHLMSNVGSTSGYRDLNSKTQNTQNTQNSLISFRDLQNLNVPGKSFNKRKLEGPIVYNDSVSSNFELRLGQPSVQNQTSKHSVLTDPLHKLNESLFNKEERQFHPLSRSYNSSTYSPLIDRFEGNISKTQNLMELPNQSFTNVSLKRDPQGKCFHAEPYTTYFPEKCCCTKKTDGLEKSQNIINPTLYPSNLNQMNTYQDRDHSQGQNIKKVEDTSFQWRDVPRNIKDLCNPVSKESPRVTQDAESSLKDLEVSTLSSVCSALVNPVKIDNKKESNAVNLVDEGSGIDQCCSSNDGLEKPISSNDGLEKPISSLSLIDELRLRDSLRMKKNQCLKEDDIKHVEISEKRKKMKWKRLNESFSPSKGPSKGSSNNCANSSLEKDLHRNIVNHDDILEGQVIKRKKFKAITADSSIDQVHSHELISDNNQFNNCKLIERPIVCGKYGIITNGSTLKTPKIVPMKRIYSLAQRCSTSYAKSRFSLMRKTSISDNDSIEKDVYMECNSIKNSTPKRQGKEKLVMEDKKSIMEDQGGGICCVCGRVNNDDEFNYLLTCNTCSIKVHQACYGVLKVPKGDWYCRPCKTSSKDIACVLCGYGGGAMTRAVQSHNIVKSLLQAWNIKNYDDSIIHNSIVSGLFDHNVKQWVHMVCGLWTPGTSCPIVETMSAFDVSGVTSHKLNMVCIICNRPGGTCIQCRVKDCSLHFHPWCAHLKGLLQSEIEGCNNENVGFYGTCMDHFYNHHSKAEEKKQFSCARTEGYKGRKRDNSQNIPSHSMENSRNGCHVTQEQLNAWVLINGQKPFMKGPSKIINNNSQIDYDYRKKYIRYKQSKGWKELVVYKSGIHGLGLYTSQFISRNSVVVEYIGEIVGLKVADKRESEYQCGKKVQYKSACYFFKVDKQYIIDATRKGGIARFVNHSCSPNCVAKVITLRSEKKVVFIAERDIFPGEEITYDYHFNHEDEGKKIPCFCNSENCRYFLN